MSAENVDRSRRLVEAYNARDFAAFVAKCDPSVALHSVFAVGGGLYRGHDGIGRWWRDLEEAWGGAIRIEPEHYIDLGERTYMPYVLHGRGPQSGVEVAMPGALILTWREGLVVLVNSYADRDKALSDLGVSLDELERIAP